MYKPEFTHYLTTGQVAATFDVDVSTVCRWVQKGHIVAGKFGTGRTSPAVFSTDVVEDFGEALAELHEAKRAAA